MKGRAVKLASGGHATVWLARSGTELVARKLPHAHLVDDPEMRASLRREAEIALQLRHPNVVRLRSIELEDDVPVLVMDYVDGTTLSDLVRDWMKHARGAGTTSAALRIVLDAAEGLHALHELRNERGEPLGLVHRDVSPQNVLVGLDGRARVSDFGLTKCLASDRATTEGVLKGKAGYLAPEYIRGERGDRRQDVFSLAVVAWETLTRARLFRGENDAQTLDRVLTMDIPPLASKDPALESIGAALDPVLRRALERDPADRYESAAAFAHSLHIATERAGLTPTADDVRASFSEALVAELERRRAELDARPATDGRGDSARTKWWVGAGVAAVAVVGGAVVALNGRGESAARDRAAGGAANAALLPAPPSPTSSSSPRAPPSLAASASGEVTPPAGPSASNVALDVGALPDARKVDAPKNETSRGARKAPKDAGSKVRPNPY